MIILNGNRPIEAAHISNDVSDLAPHGSKSSIDCFHENRKMHRREGLTGQRWWQRALDSGLRHAIRLMARETGSEIPIWNGHFTMQKRMAPQSRDTSRSSSRGERVESAFRRTSSNKSHDDRRQVDDASLKKALRRASSIVFNAPHWSLERQLVEPR